MNPSWTTPSAAVSLCNALLAVAGVGSLFPAMFRRNVPVNPRVFEPLLDRVHALRRSKFRPRYAHFNAVKARTKLLAHMREQIGCKKELLRRGR